MRIGSLVGIGAFDLLAIYGRSLGPLYSLALISLASLWVLALVLLGLAARSGRRWAFLAGIALYGADMLALMLTFSI